ncbi:MAG: serine/threonine-protein kinase [Aggregatilineales bacterium]
MDVGVEFGHYRVIAHIGRGGMADVWSARDQRLGRTVAVKTIARDLSQEMNPMQLFEREAQTIAALEHPHILPIYEFGEFAGQLYIVMRYVSGGSLEDVLERGPLSPEETMRIARAVGQALEYAHNNKVIHLDLKPSNILLDSYQSPYLADFGLATVLGPEGRAANPRSGTLLYMAPEQLTADVLDHRADIYSFAILIFHMITGQLPFDAAMPLALKQLQFHENLPDITTVRPGLPPALTTVLRHASEPEPARRPAMLRHVLDGLEAVFAPGRAVVSLDTAAPPPTPASGVTQPLGDLITGPVEDLITKPDLGSPQPSDAQRRFDEIVTGPIEGLITRPESPAQPAADQRGTRFGEIITGPVDRLVSPVQPEGSPPIDLDNLISRPVERVSPPGGLTKLEIDVSDLGELPSASPEALARREAIDLYQRARRAYAHGRGRFLLGITDYILIADYYARAEEHHLELDDAGRQMLLRGALEYDYEIDFWWAQLDDSARRWTALHALRSESAPARVRALERLAALPDSDPPQIPRRVAQALQVETNRAARLAGIRLLGTRARLMPSVVSPQSSSASGRISQRLKLAAPNDWRPAVYSAEIDLLLASAALDSDEPQVAELAARTIGQIRSEVAARDLARRQRAGERGALRALALVRDEAPSLPAVVGPSVRAYAWLANTWRRLSDRPLAAVWRFLLAIAGSALAIGVYVWTALASSAGAALVIPEVWGRAVSIGLTFGVFMGFVVLLGDEVPQRLRHFWPWWARILLAGFFGFALGTFTWGAYNYLVLNDPNIEWWVMAYGGAGIAAAFVILNLLRLPGWLATIITVVAFYLPLYWVWDGFWNAGRFPVSIIYFFEYEQVFTWLIPVVVVIALGINAQALAADVRALLRRAR